MAQLTRDQWAGFTQEQRDKFLRGLVTYSGGTVTGRFTQPPKPVLELKRLRRMHNNYNRAHGYETFDNEADMLLNADYSAIERRLLASMTQEERDAIETYYAKEPKT